MQSSGSAGKRFNPLPLNTSVKAAPAVALPGGFASAILPDTYTKLLDDNNGRMTGLTDRSGRHKFSCDEYGKVLTDNDLRYSYDAKQRLNEFHLKAEQYSYICFSADEIRCIRRITETEESFILEFTMGKWEDRATLSYQPINTVCSYNGVNYDNFGRPEGHRYFKVMKERLTPYLIEEQASGQGISTFYFYGKDGRLQRLETGESTLTYSYLEGTGFVAQSTWQRGNNAPFITLSYAYDQYLRLTEIKLNGTPVTGYQLNHDDQRLKTTLSDASIWNYTYDTLGQLKTAKRGTANNMSYNYDGIGNRQSAAEDGVATIYTANLLNQYTQINAEAPTYDADGNMLTWNGWTYTWNREKRLIKAEKGTVTFEADYDYMGRRFEKKIYQNGSLVKHQRFTYDGYKLIAIHSVLGDRREEATFQWQPVGLDTPLCMTRNGETYYYITDGNKKVIKLLKADGAEAANYTYAPFGATLSQSGDMAELNPFRFSSEFHDDEIGLIYYNYRYYNPALGRWTRRDPIEEEGGVNLYGMNQNIPNNYIDRLGLDFIAVADRAVRRSLKLGNHYSLQHWKCCADQNTYSLLFEPKGFSEQELIEKCGQGGGKLASVELLASEDWKAVRHLGNYGARGAAGFIIYPRLSVPESIRIAVIFNSDTGDKIMPIFMSGDANMIKDRWDTIMNFANQYQFAEHGKWDTLERFEASPNFSNWPLSLYFILGTNSNTFVRALVTWSGLTMVEMTGPHPGDLTPRPNVDAGKAPFVREFIPWR